jgi:hypothetical protein
MKTRLPNTRLSPVAVVLFAVAACKGPPARFVAGIADTVVLNNRLPVPIPMRVFDEAGHLLPDTSVRYQWTAGMPVSVSQRGVVTCSRAGDARVRASLGPRVTSILVRCRPVHDIFGGGELNFVVGDPPRDLLFAPVDSAGRPVTSFVAGIDYDSTIVKLEGWRIHARAPGETAVDVYIGDSWVSWRVRVYERAQSLEGMRPGQHLAVPVRLAGGEMLSLQLPSSPPTVFVTILPDRDTLRVPQLAMLAANCNGGLTTGQRDYWCFALRGASVVAYHPKEDHPKEEWRGMIAVARDKCLSREATAPCPAEVLAPQPVPRPRTP